MIETTGHVAALTGQLAGHGSEQSARGRPGRSAQTILMNRLFLSQMLQFSGAFSTRGVFGGGAGEQQFASFLREEYATHLAERLQLLPETPMPPPVAE